MYQVSRGALAELCGIPVATLDGYYNELAPLHGELLHDAADLPGAGALLQAPLLYLLVRATRPFRLMETGISSGYSTRFLLEALDRNGAGHLDSIGVGELALGITPERVARALAGRPIGWLVPERLHSRWTKHIGRSEDTLGTLFPPGDRSLDFFLHDSQHVYATMTWEYQVAYAHLAPEGWLVSHDIHNSNAWPEFLRAHRLFRSAELDHDLGVVRISRAD
jgi:hypothetical protein